MEVNTLDKLLDVLKNPNQSDFDDIAISIMRNFCIKKHEADSFGKREVEYKIVDMEFYLYNAETDDWPTYNRDCLAGQWFMHKSGVDIAFETIRSAHQLLQFGGILIRGLEKYVDGKPGSYIGGSQRCQLELFNATTSLPQIVESSSVEFEIFKNKRVRIAKDEKESSEFRYYRILSKEDWEKPRLQIYEKCIADVYYVFKGLRCVPYDDAVLNDGKSHLGTKVYPR